MKYVKLAAFILCGAFMFSGCSLINGNKEALELPPNPQSFEQVYEDNGETLITVNGRTYSYFGVLKSKMSNDSIRECLGYVDDDKNMRIFSLYDDPYDNYIMVKHIGGIMDQPSFLRAVDTKQQDVFTPSYIESSGYEYWISSGLHYEMPTARIGFICNCENVKFIDYAIRINGEDAGLGETGYVSHGEVTKGALFEVDITELEYGQRAYNDEPFEVEVVFSVVDTDDNSYEVKGSYKRDMMFGAYANNLEIRYDENDGYYLFEDI